MLVPFPRGLMDSLLPHKQPAESNADVAERYKRWNADRDEFHRLIAAGDMEAIERGWQKDYFQGRDPGSERVDTHQTKLTVRPFESMKVRAYTVSHLSGGWRGWADETSKSFLVFL